MFNTEDIYDQVGKLLLNRRNHEFKNDLKLKMMGLPGNQALQVMIDHCGLADSIEVLFDESEAIFAVLLEDQICMMPGLTELLSTLESRNIPKAVATSSSAPFAVRALGCFGLQPRFEFILTSADVENGKPHPDIYQLACKKLNLSTKDVLVLEDSLFGSQAAVAAGTVTIAVPTIHSRDCNFDHVFAVADSLRDQVIFDLIESNIG